MGAYAGGSAYAMASQITEGYASLTGVSVRRFTNQELLTLRHELDKMVASLRGEVVPEGELERIKARNRKVTRINQAVLVIQNQLQKRR